MAFETPSNFYLADIRREKSLRRPILEESCDTLRGKGRFEPLDNANGKTYDNCYNLKAPGAKSFSLPGICDRVGVDAYAKQDGTYINGELDFKWYDAVSAPPGNKIPSHSCELATTSTSFGAGASKTSAACS